MRRRGDGALKQAAGGRDAGAPGVRRGHRLHALRELLDSRLALQPQQPRFRLAAHGPERERLRSQRQPST